MSEANRTQPATFPDESQQKVVAKLSSSIMVDVVCSLLLLSTENMACSPFVRRRGVRSRRVQVQLGWAHSSGGLEAGERLWSF
jgi:hypothetical protein